VGLIVFPVFRPPLPPEMPRTIGEFLAAEFVVLDRIAAASGISPLTAFADQRPVQEDLDGPPWELDEVHGPCDDWFPAGDGQVALAGLARVIRMWPELANDLESPDRVAEELDDLARILAVAAGAGAEFRLEIR
jgi:hypothetical protein